GRDRRGPTSSPPGQHAHPADRAPRDVSSCAPARLAIGYSFSTTREGFDVRVLAVAAPPGLVAPADEGRPVVGGAAAGRRRHRPRPGGARARRVRAPTAEGDPGLRPAAAAARAGAPARDDLARADLDPH